MTRTFRGRSVRLAIMTFVTVVSIPGIAPAADWLSAMTEASSLLLLGASLCVMGAALRRRREELLARQSRPPSEASALTAGAA